MVCTANSQEELDHREKLCIRLFNSIKNGYNVHEGGKSQRLSIETREKISKANKGKKRSDESKERYRRARLGTTQPESVKIKCSESQKGEKSAWFGRKHSKESIERIREGNLGKTISESQKEKQRRVMTGRKASLTTKQKMSEKRKGRRPNCKKVKCITNGETYESVLAAAKALGMGECTAGKILRTKKPAKGCMLEYV